MIKESLIFGLLACMGIDRRHKAASVETERRKYTPVSARKELVRSLDRFSETTKTFHDYCTGCPKNEKTQ